MEKLCLHCGEAMRPGRADKKFCDDHCRGLYNYETTADNDPIVKLISGIIKKNRRIMLELINPEGKIKVTKQALTDRGFNFNYYTSIRETEKGDRYFYCFEMGYIVISEKSCLLVRKDNYEKAEPSAYRPYTKDQIPSYQNTSTG